MENGVPRTALLHEKKPVLFILAPDFTSVVEFDYVGVH